MSNTDLFNPLLASGLQKITTPGFVTFATVAAAKSGQPIGTDAPVCYITEKEAFYAYDATLGSTADDDLILTTGAGGVTRWQLLQKASRTQGDTGMVDWDTATLTIVPPVLPALVPTIIRLTFATTATLAIKSIRYGLAAGDHNLTITGAAGVKFIYFDDGSGTLKSRDDLWDFSTQAPVAIVYWTGTAIAGAQTEFHGIRDNVWHYYAHTYHGSQYKSGLSFTSATPVDSPANPPNATVQYLWSTTGYIQDEDALINVGVGNWLQDLGSGLTSADAAVIPFYYWNGSFITTMAAMADRTPFIHAGGNTTPQWENAGVLTASVDDDYIVYHYFASPQIAGQAVFARPHNAKFTSLALAQAARPASLTWSNYAELKHIYSAVFRVGTTGGSNFTNSPHRCKIASLQDFRNVAGGPVAATNPTTHSGLSGLSDAGAHPAIAISLDPALFDKNLAITVLDVQSLAESFDEFASLPSNATNASASPDLTNKVAFASSADGTSATFTFDARGVIDFQIDCATAGGLVISCDYKSADINALSDPSNLFLTSDSGTGVFVSKSANSSAVTIKNRLGSTHLIGVLAVRSPLTATAWS